jgi:hypothetical protein
MVLLVVRTRSVLSPTAKSYPFGGRATARVSVRVSVPLAGSAGIASRARAK